MADIARSVLLTKNTDQLPAVLQSEYRRLGIYPRITKEQQLAFLYSNDIKRAILGRLREEGILLLSELDVWIKDEFKEGGLDPNTIVNSMLKNNLAKLGSAKGYSGDLVFMIGDLMISRKPPRFYRNPTEFHCPKSLRDEYRTRVRNYFTDYFPSDGDNLNIIDKILLDPVNSVVLELLRLAITTRSDLEKLKQKGVDDIDQALADFESLNLITVLQDAEGVEYYGLLSDFEIRHFLPRYMLNLVRQNYIVKRHNNDALVTHLDMLREEYARLEKERKKVKRDEAPESYTAADAPMNLSFDITDDLEA